MQQRACENRSAVKKHISICFSLVGGSIQHTSWLYALVTPTLQISTPRTQDLFARQEQMSNSPNDVFGHVSDVA